MFDSIQIELKPSNKKWSVELEYCLIFASFQKIQNYGIHFCAWTKFQLYFSISWENNNIHRDILKQKYFNQMNEMLAGILKIVQQVNIYDVIPPKNKFPQFAQTICVTKWNFVEA